MTMVTNTSPRAGAKPNRQQRRQAARLAKKGRRGNGAAAPTDAALQEAVKLHKAGHSHEALQLYRKILAVRPDRVDALNFGGVASFQSGHIAEAVEMLQKAVALKPDDAEIHTNLGNVLQASGRVDRALAAYGRAIEIEPQRAQAHYNLGLLLKQDGKVEQAAAAYRRAIEIEPDHAEAHHNLGVLLQESRDTAGAVAAHRRVIEINPSCAEAHNSLGAILQEFGEMDEAIAACRRAIEIQPDYTSAYNNLGTALGMCGKFDEAMWALNRALEIKPDHGNAHYNLGHVLYRETDPKPAANAFAKALECNPYLAMAHFYLGVIRDQQGDASASGEHFAKLARVSRDARPLVDTWTYAKTKRNASTRFHSGTFETLKFALEKACVDGLVLEFGVRFGNSINFIARHAAGPVHGFDSFEGLPEAWGRFQAGAYSTGGRIPEVASNVRLHAGWFSDTLPAFVNEHPGPIRFMNVDCDLYSSTKTIFELLADRIVPGTVIVFDEYLINPTWRDDEYKAFQEAVERHFWNYEYLAFNLFSKQAAVKIL